MIDLEALRAVALKATAGPWRTARSVSGNGLSIHIATDGPGTVASVGDHDLRCGGLHETYASPLYNRKSDQVMANATFIATFNPAVALELLDTIAELRAQLAPRSLADAAFKHNPIPAK